jgi:hypothetical protein
MSRQREQREPLAMAVWAVYGRQASGERLYLKSVSVISAERARNLAERDRQDGAEMVPELVVREFTALHAVPWCLDATLNASR